MFSHIQFFTIVLKVRIWVFDFPCWTLEVNSRGQKSLMIFRQNLDVSNIVRDSFYLKLCHFWKLTEFLVLPSSRFHANTKVCYGEMNIYLLDPVQNFRLYFLSTTYLKHLTFLEPRSFFGAANIMHWKSIMDTVFDIIFRGAKDWFET